jgi:hypothetical protein
VVFETFHVLEKLRAPTILLAMICALVALPRVSSAQGFAATSPPSAKLPSGLLANRCYTTIDDAMSGVDVRALIHTASIEDVERLRSRLVAQIWPGGFPRGVLRTSVVQTTPQNSVRSASGLYEHLSLDADSNLQKEHRLTINVGFGIKSIVYLWTPRVSNNKLFLVHDGHSDDSFDAKGAVSVRAIVNTTNYVTVKALLREGYAVMWFQMPLYGDNLSQSSPPAAFRAECRAGCDRHAEIFRVFGRSRISPYRFFLEPVLVSINYALRHAAYSSISIMGASGGGWVTLLAAAIDPRIASSASVAASLPLNLRTGACGTASVGDAEQRTQPGLLYKDISYLDLYIMAASGANRYHLQINNQFDTCCFFGTTYLTYADYLTNLVNLNGLGKYEYYLDRTFAGHGYNVTDGAMPSNNTLDNVVLPAFAKMPGK